MKKIAIFDLDGTLLNTLEDLTDSTNFALKQCGYPVRSLEEIRNFVGNGVQKLIKRAVPDGKNTKECIKIFKQHYSQNMYNKTKPYDGVLTLLETLKSKGIKIAVVSNKFDLAVKKLCAKYFGDLIDFAAGENEEKGISKKPSPDSIYTVLNEYNLTPDDGIYIGDSEVDIQTAKNAGMTCISVTWGFKTREFLIKNKAENIADKPDEVLDFLLKNNKKGTEKSAPQKKD